MSAWYHNSDRVITINNLKINGVVVATATLTLEGFKEVDSVINVSGITYPALFTNLGSGDYELTIPATVLLTLDKYYEAEIKIDYSGKTQTIYIIKRAQKYSKNCC